LVLLSRRDECDALDRLLAAVYAGESRAVVVRGEPGVGKSALLGYVAERAPGFHLARAVGVQSEMELAYAGLHQLCGPLLHRIDGLPGHLGDALRTALGLSAGPAPDPFLVGLAVLGLLAETAQERPLLCLVDDAHWLDRASVQAMTFAARRLQAESVAMVFAARLPAELPALVGIAELLLGGLPDTAARALLRSVLPGPVDEPALDRIVAETHGNPLALVELPHGQLPAELAGGFGLPGARGITGRIEESYLQRLAPLPAQTRLLLLVAAADPTGDPVLLWRAAERLSAGVEAAGPAAEAELLEVSAQVRFRHPLVRSAIYWDAAPDDRRSAHRALAEVTDPDAEPDRRAWHTAQATAGPDEDAAAQLERSAGRARARGGLAAAAAFLERATELTPQPQRRGERALAAARTMHEAASPAAASRLLSIAEAGPLDEPQRAQVDLLRAQIEFAVNRGSEAPGMLLKAANRLEAVDVRVARDTYLEAMSAAMFLGPLATGGGLREVAEAARAAPPLSLRAADLLLEGLAIRFTAGYAAGAPAIRRALRAFRGPDLSAEDGLRWLWLASTTAVDLWDEVTWEVLAHRHVQLAREAGALTMLPLALTSRIAVHTFTGELSAAASLHAELAAVTEATRTRLPPYGGLLLAAWRGDKTEAAALIEATCKDVVLRGEGIGLTVAGWARALLCNSLGLYDDALAAAEQASDEHPEQLGASIWALVELVEAAARNGRPERAADAFGRLAVMTQVAGTDWASGVESRARALVSDDSTAEHHYRDAIDRLRRTRFRPDRARAHLLYGEWLRRQRRKSDARHQLRTAHELFGAMGLEAFAQRAARELQATGEHVRKRSVEIPTELTAQEAQIVQLVREGHSNPEIGALLFISPRTVEWHLRNAFGKLNITSRRQLRR
jgi:DNA-binding CsgD family transcriptional regulator